VWVGVGVARNGLGIGPPSRRWVTGRFAWVIGGIVAALGLAAAIVGIIYVPDWIGSVGPK